MEYTRKWVGVVGFFLSLWVYDLSMVGISEKSQIVNRGGDDY